VKTTISKQQVKHIATLANIPISEQEVQSLEKAFAETLKVVDKLQSVDVTNVKPTHQVTGLTNIFREDIVDKDRMLSQNDALANSRKTHNGYFVVPRIIDKD